MNVVTEIYKLRAAILETVNKNPLPATIKLMVANELVTALSNAEAIELKHASSQLKTESVKENEKEVEKTDG
jgi:VIT1/CCC1 family predicted Fe2+/Mn2+ transporter